MFLLGVYDFLNRRAGVLPGYERDYLLYYLVSLVACGASGLLFPVRAIYLVHSGLPLFEYGLFVASGAALAALTQSWVGRLSDHLRTRKWPLITALAGLSLTSLGIASLHQPLLLGSVLVLDGAFWAEVYTMLYAISSSLTRSDRLGSGIGWFRSGSSLGWVIGTLVLGFIVDPLGPPAAFMYAAALILLSAVAALVLTREPPYEARITRSKPLTPRRRLGALSNLQPQVVWFLVVVLLLNFAQTSGFTYRPLFLQEVKHASEPVIAWIMSFQAVLEIPFMIWFGAWSDRIGRRQLLALAFMATCLRWLGLFAAPSAIWVFPLQLLHAASFAGLVVVAAAYLADISLRENRGLAMGLLSTAQNTGAALAPLAAGALASSSLSAVMLLASGTALLGLLIFLWTAPSRLPLQDRAVPAGQEVQPG